MSAMNLIIRLPDDVARAVEETTPDRLRRPEHPPHVTVAHVPDVAVGSRLRLSREMYRALAGMPALDLEIVGTGHLYRSGTVVRLVSAPGIESIRAAAPVPGRHPWGLIPHVTIGYLEDDAVVEPEPLHARWRACELELVVGDETVGRIPLV